MDITTKKERLYAELKEGIREGRFREKFPPEPLFARQLGVSRNTLRAVYRLLEADGLLRRHSGSGTTPVTEEEVRENNILFAYSVFSRGPSRDFIIPAISRGIERALPPGWNLESCPYPRLNELPVEKALQILKARNIRGVVLNTSNFFGNESVLELLRLSRLPAVLCYCKAQDHAVTGLPSVAQVTAQAWEAGLRHLFANGHRHVATIDAGENPEQVRRAFSREEYAALLLKIGLDPDPELVLHLPVEDEAVFQALSALPRKFTAIMCYSDLYAQSVYRALKRMRLAVPEDVSVMGYSGTGGGVYFNPPLSTVEIDYAGVGSQAVELLKNAGSRAGKSPAEVPLLYARFTLRNRESLKNILI
ncbi:MAG: GntR family transcriptional regulator [Lentisphaeria bacterium]|nr:GntR family transcriptional regulator [Lentisphaeria bacterium]